MQIYIWKSGCSCGCTPSEEVIIKSETKEALVNGIAYQFANYTTRNRDKYSKINFADNKFVTRKEVICVADKICPILDEIDNLQTSIENLEEEKFIPIFKTRDPEKFPLPKELTEENERSEKEFNEKKINEIENLKFRLRHFEQDLQPYKIGWESKFSAQKSYEEDWD